MEIVMEIVNDADDAVGGGVEPRVLVGTDEEPPCRGRNSLARRDPTCGPCICQVESQTKPSALSSATSISDQASVLIWPS